jgi:hypothetical protein
MVRTFDETKDQVLDSRTGIERERTRILVQICSYNGGQAKLQLKRENKSSDGWTFAKLGRMTGEEFSELVPVALELIDANGVK